MIRFEIHTWKNLAGTDVLDGAFAYGLCLGARSSNIQIELRPETGHALGCHKHLPRTMHTAQPSFAALTGRVTDRTDDRLSSADERETGGGIGMPFMTACGYKRPSCTPLIHDRFSTHSGHSWMLRLSQQADSHPYPSPISMLV